MGQEVTLRVLSRYHIRREKTNFHIFIGEIQSVIITEYNFFVTQS